MKKVSRELRIFDCLNGDKVKVLPRKDGKAVVIESTNRQLLNYGGIDFKFNDVELLEFLKELINYLEDWGITDITPEDRCYSEEIHVYKDEVERSITTAARSNSFSFIAYTYDEDAYWTYLTPRKLKYFVELMLPGTATSNIQ